MITTHTSLSGLGSFSVEFLPDHKEDVFQVTDGIVRIPLHPGFVCADTYTARALVLPLSGCSLLCSTVYAMPKTPGQKPRGGSYYYPLQPSGEILRLRQIIQAEIPSIAPAENSGLVDLSRVEVITPNGIPANGYQEFELVSPALLQWNGRGCAQVIERLVLRGLYEAAA